MEARLLKRYEDWPVRLAAFFESRRRAPFQWGAHDCALFAADEVVAITGDDLALPWRGAYATEAAAQVLIGADGLQGLVDRVALPRVMPKQARRGDILLFESQFGATLGVCDGRWIVSPALVGFRMTAIDKAVCAWMVG